MRFLKIFSILVAATLFLYLVCVADADSVYNDVIRMHILAASDGEADQAVKLEVRDLVLATYGEALSGYRSRAEAMEAAKALLPSITKTVNLYLAEKTEYTATVSLEESYFPTKSYGELTLPRGRYTALCIRLSRAEGRNFFCVLYPPLCLGAATEGEEVEEMFLNCGLTLQEYELLRGKKPIYQIKFKLLELFRGA